MFSKKILFLSCVVNANVFAATVQPLNDPLWQQIILDLKTDAAALTGKYSVAFNALNPTTATNDLIQQTAKRYNVDTTTVSNFFNTAKTTPISNNSADLIFNHVGLALNNWVNPLINLIGVDLSKATDEISITNTLKPLLKDQTVLSTTDYQWVTASLWYLTKLKNTYKITCGQYALTSIQINQRLAQGFAQEFGAFSHLGEADLNNAALLAMDGRLLNENNYPDSKFPLWATILIYGLENLASQQHDTLVELQAQVTAEKMQVNDLAKQLQTYPSTLPTDVTTLQTLNTNIQKQVNTLQDFSETCPNTTGKTAYLTMASSIQTKIENALDSQSQVNKEINQINAIATHLQGYPSPLPTDLAQLQALSVDINTQINLLENFEETVPNSTGKAAVLAVALQLQIKIENAIDTAKENLSELERLKVVYQQLTTIDLQTASDKFTSDDFDYAIAEVVKPNVTVKAMITLLDNLAILKNSTYKNAGSAKAAYDDLVDAVDAEIESVNNFTLQLFVNPTTVNNPLYGYNGVSFYITNGAVNVSKMMIALYNVNRQHPLGMSPLVDRIFHGEMPANIMDALYTKKPKLVRSDWIDVNNFKDQFLSALRGGEFGLLASGKNYTAFSDTLGADLFLD
jgi:hypothetical protein